MDHAVDSANLIDAFEVRTYAPPNTEQLPLKQYFKAGQPLF